MARVCIGAERCLSFDSQVFFMRHLQDHASGLIIKLPLSLQGGGKPNFKRIHTLEPG